VQRPPRDVVDRADLGRRDVPAADHHRPHGHRYGRPWAARMIKGAQLWSKGCHAQPGRSAIVAALRDCRNGKDPREVELAETYVRKARR
jgi:hypothetical protein